MSSIRDRFTIGDWASRGTFQPLERVPEREKDAPDAIREENFYPAAWKEAVYEGKVYAVPTGIDSRLLFYNRTLFREVTDPDRPPRTWTS